jgi:hypothetical protein
MTCTRSSVSATTSAFLLLHGIDDTYPAQLYSRLAPFQGLTEIATALRVVAGKRPSRPTASPAPTNQMWSLITQCWHQASGSRPTAAVVCTFIGHMAILGARRQPPAMESSEPRTRSSTSDGGSSRYYTPDPTHVHLRDEIDPHEGRQAKMRTRCDCPRR